MTGPGLDALAKLLGVKNPTKTGTTSAAKSSAPLAPPKARTNFSGTRQEAKSNAQADARDEQSYLQRRSEELRARRLEGLKRQSRDVRRFLQTLNSLEAEAECTGYRDCDVDISGLAEELNLRGIPDVSLRFLLASEAHEWIIRLAKRRGMKRQDYFDSADYFEVPDGSKAMDQLNAYLGVT